MRTQHVAEAAVLVYCGVSCLQLFAADAQLACSVVVCSCMALAHIAVAHLFNGCRSRAWCAGCVLLFGGSRSLGKQPQAADGRLCFLVWCQLGVLAVHSCGLRCGCGVVDIRLGYFVP